jgi:hypothetical protein
LLLASLVGRREAGARERIEDLVNAKTVTVVEVGGNRWRGFLNHRQLSAECRTGEQQMVGVTASVKKATTDNP